MKCVHDKTRLECPLCGKFFALERFLKQHLRKDHKLVEAEIDPTVQQIKRKDPQKTLKVEEGENEDPNTSQIIIKEENTPQAIGLSELLGKEGQTFVDSEGQVLQVKEMEDGTFVLAQTDEGGAIDISQQQQIVLVTGEPE